MANATEAGDRLVDRLVELVGGIDGPVLDVACGTGGTTRRLSEHVPADRVSAINVSAAQLADARRRVPQGSFHLMDAAVMAFADASFKTVVCVEAAFHFRTRRRFLEEAFRVLEPGGALAVSDLLMARLAPMIPNDNYVDDVAGYADLLAAVGFEQVVVEPVRAMTWDAFRLRLSDFITANRSRYRSVVSVRDLYYLNTFVARMIRESLLASARKPAK